MDTEQLKLIIDAVSGMGSGAYIVAVLFVVRHYFTTAVVGSVLFCLLSVLYRLIKQAIDENSLTHDIKVILNYRHDGPLSADDRMTVLKLVRTHYSK